MLHLQQQITVDQMGLEITDNVAPFDEILVLLREKISQDPENLTTVRIYSRVISSGVACVPYISVRLLHFMVT